MSSPDGPPSPPPVGGWDQVHKIIRGRSRVGRGLWHYGDDGLGHGLMRKSKTASFRHPSPLTCGEKRHPARVAPSATPTIIFFITTSLQGRLSSPLHLSTVRWFHVRHPMSHICDLRLSFLFLYFVQRADNAIGDELG